MIYCLTGKLLEKAPDYAVVSCGGVGYLAAIPSTTAGALPAVGDTCTLYTCMNVTENDVSLFGFADKESQTMFRLLTGVSGVGPKVGLAILSVLSPDRVVLAISAGDHKAFTAASGVGPKLGQRIVLELKDKVGKGLATGLGGRCFRYGSACSHGRRGAGHCRPHRPGLYGQRGCAGHCQAGPSLPVQELIRLALQGIGKGR